MKAPDIVALDCALKVEQYFNATKSKNKIIKVNETISETKRNVYLL